MRNWLASFGRHKGLKLLALLLAVALWVVVGSEEPTEVTLNIPLQLTNVPPHLTITSEVPATLQVRVIGPGSVVRQLSQDHLSYTVDLSGYKYGRHSIPVGVKSFKFPRGVTVIRVQPNPINLTFTPTITRTLQIQPLLEGSPPEGYTLLKVETRPAQITVRGSYSEIADLKFLTTIPIDLTHFTESTTVATDIDFKNLHLTTLEQTPILADITIGPKEATRTFATVPVEATPHPARLVPAQVALTVRGPWFQVQDLKPADLKAEVATGSLRPGRHHLKVSVTLPAGLRLVKVQPDTVSTWPRKSP